MIEITIAKTLFLVCFALGFAAAMLLTLVALGGFFLMRLWSLRDDLKALKEILVAGLSSDT